MARFMNMDVVGVLVFRLGFVFGSPLHLGWHPCLDGDFPFVDCRGGLSKEVPMGPCGRLSIVVMGGHSH